MSQEKLFGYLVEFETAGDLMKAAEKVRVAGQLGHNDHKTLEAHADVHADCNDPHDRDIVTEFLHPEDLGDQDITADHDPVCPGHGPKGTVHKGKHLQGIAPVPGDEELHRVGVAHH